MGGWGMWAPLLMLSTSVHFYHIEMFNPGYLSNSGHGSCSPKCSKEIPCYGEAPPLGRRASGEVDLRERFVRTREAGVGKAQAVDKGPPTSFSLSEGDRNHARRI